MPPPGSAPASAAVPANAAASAPGAVDATGAVSTRVRVPWPVDLRTLLGPLRRGPADPHCRFAADGFWRACATPAGPGTLHLTRAADGAVVATAWGPGAEWLVASVPDLLGARDDPTGIRPAHRPVREALRRRPELRVGRTGLVFDALFPAVLEQKVTGLEAYRSFRELTRRFGAPAPGPAGVVPPGLRVPPTAADVRRIPSWEWHRAGVDDRRARAAVTAAGRVGRVEQTAALPGAEARERLCLLPGVGVWTAAETAQRALGDADAVSVGDYHLAKFVGWALVGYAVDDDGMLELLEPYRPHRYRVIRLLALGGARKPRFGPRFAPPDFRGI